MIADAPPFAGLAIILALTVPVLLALLPAYPRSKIILVLWIAGLILAAVISVWGAFFSSPLLWEGLWETPAWHRPIYLVCYVAIPFLTSFLLWQVRKNSSRLSATTTSIIMVMVCVISWFAVTTFNRTCVFYDVFHDGDARGWCPDSWPWQLRSGPNFYRTAGMWATYEAITRLKRSVRTSDSARALYVRRMRSAVGS